MIPWLAIAAVVAGVAIWMVVSLSLKANAAREKAHLATDLAATTQATATFVADWSRGHQTLTAFIAADEDARSHIATIASAETTPQARSRAIEALEALVSPLIGESGGGYRGFIVSDSEGTVLHAVSSGTEPVRVDLPGSHGFGNSLITLVLDPSNETAQIATVRVWAPVATEDETIAWFALDVDPGSLGAFIATRIGSTTSGEIYFFDAGGRMLSPSSFERELREMGLLRPGESSVGLLLVVPEGAGEGAGSLTRMAREATNGNPGVDVDGYLDYRGVEVIGAWTWIDELDVGLTIEVDHAEAYAAVTETSRTWTFAAGVLILLVGILTTLVGITQRRLARLNANLEDEVAERTGELSAAKDRLLEEVAAKDRLLAAVSHELRTPLSGILGFARVLAEADDEPLEDRQELVSLIVSEAEDMADMIDDLLTSARAATGKLEVQLVPVDLADEARAMLKRLGQPNGVSGAHEVTVQGDPARIRQIIRNLVTNAIRHGGPDIRTHVEVVGGEAILSVSDDGAEIPPEVARQMFHMYFSQDVKGPAPSLGIGLALSGQLATAMGGSLSYWRDDNRNRFELHLRVVSEDLDSPAIRERTAAA